MGELFAKKEQQEGDLTDDICYLKNICRTEQTFISCTNEDKLNIDGVEHVLAFI